MQPKNIQVEDIEFKEAKARFRLDIRSTRVMMLSFGILAIIVKLFFLKRLLLFPILLIISAWFLFYFVYEYLIKKTKTIAELYNVYFFNNILDLLVLTIIIHFIGGAEWIGMMFYILSLLLAGIILPKGRTITLGFVAALFYSALISLEYLGVLPHRTLFVLTPGLYQSPSYVVTQILIVTAIFYFVVDTAGTFSEMLKRKNRELAKEREKVAMAYKELQEAKEVLEIKVEARTKELKKLTENLEEKVQLRTEELQEKIKELERAQKLFVGRESKMIELKEEIKRLKTGLKNKHPKKL